MLRIEILCDGYIVMSYDLECTCGKLFALFEAGRARLVAEELFQVSVIAFCCHYNYVFKVLGCATDHGRSADIDLFDDELFFSSGGHSFFRRVERSTITRSISGILYCFISWRS